MGFNYGHLCTYLSFLVIHCFITCLGNDLSEYSLAVLGFILAFLCGTLIDLPFMMLSGMTWKALWIRLLLGFQVSLGNGLSTFLATLFLYPPLSKVIKKMS